MARAAFARAARRARREFPVCNGRAAVRRGHRIGWQTASRQRYNKGSNRLPTTGRVSFTHTRRTRVRVSSQTLAFHSRMSQFATKCKHPDTRSAPPKPTTARHMSKSATKSECPGTAATMIRLAPGWFVSVLFRTRIRRWIRHLRSEVQLSVGFLSLAELTTDVVHNRQSDGCLQRRRIERSRSQHASKHSPNPTKRHLRNTPHACKTTAITNTVPTNANNISICNIACTNASPRRRASGARGFRLPRRGVSLGSAEGFACHCGGFRLAGRMVSLATAEGLDR